MRKKQRGNRERTLTGWLYRFMEEKSPWFWGIFSIVMVLILYKAFNIAFLGKTPYLWDNTFQHITLSLVCILMMREAYKGEFCLGFTTAHFWQGILLCWPALLFIVFNLCCNLGPGHIYAESLIMLLWNYGSVGLFEEVVVRAILVGHMMHYWRDAPHRIRKAVLWSSVIFGVLHIGNIFSNPIGTATQILYGTGVGILFAAVYIRTRNLWSCILVHSMIDFFASIDQIFVPLQADMAAYEDSLAQVPQLILSRIPEGMIGSVTLFLFFLPLALALLAAGAAFYMLRSGKRGQIDILWAREPALQARMDTDLKGKP